MKKTYSMVLYAVILALIGVYANWWGWSTFWLALFGGTKITYTTKR